MEEILFKKKTRKNFRAKNLDDKEDEDLGVDFQKLNDFKELRNIKINQLRGLSAEDLLSLKKETNGKIIKKKEISAADALANDLDLGRTFSVETNCRDEDADMLKFIEKELARRKGKEKNDEVGHTKANANIDEIVFNELPKHLLVTNKNKNEEMLSNQMLNGIPEIDLGFNEKVRNIEATEEAKKKIINKSSKKDFKNTSFVPSNMATNFVEPNKFNVAENNLHQNKKLKVEPIKLVKEPVVVIGNDPKEGVFKIKKEHNEKMLKHPGKEKASDDYHFEKFKKSFRK